ncbi:hypothetical protein Tco_0204396 [Tanacetum coccineum]
MSSTKVEYVVAVGCCAIILWMKCQLSDHDIHYKMVPIFCDKTNAIAISNNHVLHSRTKHIDIKYHFIRDHILKEFWCNIVVDHPTPSSEDSKAQPLRESNIKFTVKNGKMSLIVNYQTFYQSTSLEYDNGKYVAHPSTKEVKDKLEKITTHDVLVYKTLLLKPSFHTAWRILMTFVIQGFPSISDEDIRTSSFLFEEKPINPKDSEGNMYPADKGLAATNPDEGISTSHPLPEGTLTDPKDLRRTIQLTNRGLPSTIELISHGASLTLLEDSNDEIKELSDEEMYEAREEMDDPLLIANEDKSPFLHISLDPSPKASKKPKKSKKSIIKRSQPKPSPKASKEPKPSDS